MVKRNAEKPQKSKEKKHQLEVDKISEQSIKEEFEERRRIKIFEEGARIDPWLGPVLLQRLTKYQEVKGLRSRNAACKRALEIFLKDFSHKPNNVHMLDDVFRFMMESDTEEKMEKNTTKAAGRVLTKMKHQVGVLTVREFRIRLRDWHEINNVDIDRFVETTNDGRTTSRYIMSHHLGEKFSEFQLRMVVKMIERFNCKVSEDEWDEVSYTFTVEWCPPDHKLQKWDRKKSHDDI